MGHRLPGHVRGALSSQGWRVTVVRAGGGALVAWGWRVTVSSEESEFGPNGTRGGSQDLNQPVTIIRAATSDRLEFFEKSVFGTASDFSGISDIGPASEFSAISDSDPASDCSEISIAIRPANASGVDSGRPWPSLWP